jgi:signal transduction histidine kinase
LSTFLAIRAVHVIQGFTCVVTARSAYRRPKVAVAAAFTALAELAWLAQRDVSRGFHDAATARTDAVFGAVGLVVLGVATHPEDRTSSVNWMLPLSVGSCLGAAAALEPLEGASVSAVLGMAYAGLTKESITSGSGRAASAVANVVSYPGFFAVAAFVVRLARHWAGELDDARRRAVEQGARAAAEETRNQEHRLLHDSALQTLEAIASYDLDPDDLRHQARKEAAQLRRAIAGVELQTKGLIAGLEELAEEFAARGLRVELITVEVEHEPEEGIAEALCDASREALTNAAKHAGVSRVIMRVTSERDGVEVTVRDQGRGFDSALRNKGFGIDNSIVRRLAEVGGRAEISSEPGRGTRIGLWAPM